MNRSASTLLAAIMLLVGAAPAEAAAAKFNRVREAQKIAQAAFPNACPVVQIQRRDATAMENPGALAEAAPGVCLVVFNLRFVKLIGWHEFCSAMAHEYGHIAGHGHHPDEANVMYAMPLTTFPACTRIGPKPPRVTAANLKTGARGGFDSR